ncbi:MAG: T9SS type A sorting domain-containing protein [Melioribacteraceae bacterium]
MKKYFIIILLFSTVSNAQDSTNLDPYQFFPVNIGNRWEYTDAGLDEFLSIARDSIDNKDSSKIIFYDAWTSYHPSKGRFPLYRVDKNYNVFYSPFRDNRYLYKLDANLGESWIVMAEEYQAAKVIDISESYIFGKRTVVKTIGYFKLGYEDTVITENSILQYWEKLAYGFGLISQEDGATHPYLLVGCIIDGITYRTVDVKEEPQIIPTEIALYQNYPNPFNPETNISFSLADKSFVTLKVYDTLGREVKELVNDYREKGNYTIRFDGSNLSSGIYYFKLTAGNYSAIKKMSLVK